jgi:sugar transferase (PEP-CTERM/EpsH1 system associated)
VNIFYLAHRLPYPPNKGEKIRTFHQIQQLARNNTVHLCSFVDDPGDLPHSEALKKYCASVSVVYRNKALTPLLAASALLKRQPLSVALFACKPFKRKVLQKLTAEEFDCIMVSSSSMAQYASFVSAIPKIIDFIDVDSEKWHLYAQHYSFPLSFIYALEAKRLARYEENIARVFDHCVLISEEERQLFREQVKDRPVSVISNGVDLEYFSRPRSSVLHDAPPIIVFTGMMDYFPNVDAVRYFCSEIFPLAYRTVPEVKFYIVGRNPTRQVRELGSQPNVVVTGTVPDVRPYLTQATVAVAPFRLARGVQNKVLEAMAMGLPVIGTTEAFKGIAATEDDGIRIAKDPFSFAQHIIKFFQDSKTLRQQTGQQARRYVEQHHRWQDQGARLERLLEEVVWKNTAVKSARVKHVAQA